MDTYKFYVSLKVPDRDVNHRKHVAYHNFLVYFYDARTAYLEQFGYQEHSDLAYGLIVAEAHCQYKRELAEGDELRVYCRAAEVKEKMVRLQFQIKVDDALCAEGSTINLCYDYGLKKVAALPKDLADAIRTYEGKEALS